MESLPNYDNWKSRSADDDADIETRRDIRRRARISEAEAWADRPMSEWDDEERREYEATRGI